MKNFNNVLPTINNENIHTVTEFKFIQNTSNGSQLSLSMNQLFIILRQLAKSSKNISGLSDLEVKDLKACDIGAIVYSTLREQRKLNANFISRSLLSIDVDNDVPQSEKISLNDMVLKLKGVGLDALIYTSMSHSVTTDKYRVLVDIGVACDERLFKQSVYWFVDALKLTNNKAIDNVSYKRTQAMCNPVAHRYIKPQVIRIKGKSIADLYSPQVLAFQVPKITKKKQSKKSPSTNAYLSTTAIGRFKEQVEFLHKALIMGNVTNGSIQYRRNRNDKGAGLYVPMTKSVIFDNRGNKTYPLFYCPQDYAEAENHSLPSRSEITNRLLEWEDSIDNNYALLIENAGSGKSSALRNLIKDHGNRKRVFTFHTKDNRDIFYDSVKSHAVVCYGNLELIKQIIQDPQQYEDISDHITDYYDTINKDRMKLTKKLNKSKTLHQRLLISKELQNFTYGYYFDDLIDDCVSLKLISSQQKDEILKAVKANKQIFESCTTVLMTTQKLEYMASFSGEDTFKDIVVYTDESIVGMLTDIPENASQVVYGDRIELDEDVSLDFERIRQLKRCILTVEQSIVHELEHHDMSYEVISTPVKTFDQNLEILFVPSMSNKESSNFPRKSIYKKIIENKEHINIISDGLKDEGCLINHTNTKGMNNLDDPELIVFASFPHPTEIANMMECTGLDVYKTINVIMSDKVTQAVGRNMGYRNRGNTALPSMGNNHCLLLVPLPEKCQLDIHNVTTRVTRANAWNSRNQVSEAQRKEFYFRNIIEEICNIVKRENQQLTDTVTDRNNDSEAIANAVLQRVIGNTDKVIIPLNAISSDTGHPLSRINIVMSGVLPIKNVRPSPNMSKRCCIVLDKIV